MSQDFRKAEHLPKQRKDGIPPPPEQLPRQRQGRSPQLHGRYPDYDVLANQQHWDEVTRKVVLARVEETPPLRFFDAAEQRTLGRLCDLVTAQDNEPRVPVLAMVDAKLGAGKLDGYRHHDMPPDPETWKRVAAGLDESAGGSFSELDDEHALELVSRFADGKLEGEVWTQMPCGKAWGVVMRGVLAAFYSHPWAWNEIGYGGPAYPRGYMHLGPGQLEPHQRPEVGAEDPVSAVSKEGI